MNRRLLLALSICLAMLTAACSASSNVDVVNAGGAGAADAPLGDVSPGDTLGDLPVAFAATPTFLAAAAQDVAESSYRFELSMEIDAAGMALGDIDESFMEGRIRGDSSATTIHLDAMLQGLGDVGLGDAFASNSEPIEAVVADGQFCITAPPLADGFGTGAASADPSSGVFEIITTGWGCASASALADIGADAAAASFGVGNMSIGDDLLAMLNDVTDVTDGGAGEVRGVPTNIAVASADFAELLDTFAGAATGGDGTADMLQSLLGSAEADLEVHIDEAGLVRRIQFDVDLAELMAGFGESDESLAMRYRLDLFDHGGDFIILAPADATDITAELESLFANGG